MPVIAIFHSPHPNTSKHKEHPPVEKKIDYYKLNSEHIFYFVHFRIYFFCTLLLIPKRAQTSVQPRSLIIVFFVCWQNWWRQQNILNKLANTKDHDLTTRMRRMILASTIGMWRLYTF